VVTPYYNKPNPSGLIAHYKVAATAGVPLVMYHIPGRTGLTISAAVLDKLLAQIPQLVGIKECNYDMSQVTDTAVKYSNKLNYFCGNDELLLQFLSVGACGTISAAANVLAPAFVKIYNLFNAGKTHEAFLLFTRIYPLVKACYYETNPTCIKYMLHQLGFGTATVRAPLGEISTENKTKIDQLLANTNKEFLI
jgi:4-hydroxy-tetrahydrodipicolinate synthase